MKRLMIASALLVCGYQANGEKGESFSEQNVMPGDYAIIKCELEGDAPPMWKCRKGDLVEELAVTSDRFDLVGAARGTILVIDNLSKADSGTYFCENGDIRGEEQAVNVIGATISFTEDLRSTVMKKGDTYQQICQAKGHPGAQAMWYDFDGLEVGTDTPEGRLLKVEDLKEDQIYTCVIWVEDIPGLRKEKFIRLLLPEQPRLEKARVENLEAKELEDVVLSCQIEHPDEDAIRRGDAEAETQTVWGFSDAASFFTFYPKYVGQADGITILDKVQDSANFSYQIDGIFNETLTLRNVSGPMRGIYLWCFGFNGIHYTDDANRFFLHVEEYLKPADMNEDPEVLYLIEGDERQSLKVVTNKVGVKSAEVEWLKDGNPIANKLLGNEYGEDVYVETVSHRLKEVTKESEGTYRAVFTPGKGASEPRFPSKPIKVVVIKERAPVFINRPKENYYLSPGDSIEIPCEAIGVPEPKITFKAMAYRPGARLAMHIHRAVMQGSLKEIVNNAGNSLVIQNATEDNDRVYLCVAGEGDDHYISFRVHVTEVLPGKPVDLKVTKSKADEVEIIFKPGSVTPLSCLEAFEATILSHENGVANTASWINRASTDEVMECKAAFYDVNGTDTYTISVGQKTALGLGEMASVEWTYEPPVGLSVDEKLDIIEEKLYRLLYYFDIRTD